MTRLEGALSLLIIIAAGCKADRPSFDPSIGRALPPVVVPPEVEGQAYLHALVFGDWGTGREGQHVTAAAMAARARARPIDFMLTTGDNFYLHGVDSDDDPLWRTVFEEVYDDPALQVPIHPTLGNHDHMGEPDAQVAYGKKNSRWVMPSRYYEFRKELPDGTHVQFFALDTEPLAERHMGNWRQLEWLETALAGSDARWKIVYGHHPLYTHSGRGENQVLIDKLEPLFRRYRVDVYFAGHDHILELLPAVHGVQYVVSGAGGGPDAIGYVEWLEDTIYAAAGGGFVALRIGRDELVLEFVRNDARTQFVHVLAKEPAPATTGG